MAAVHIKSFNRISRPWIVSKFLILPFLAEAFERCMNRRLRPWRRLSCQHMIPQDNLPYEKHLNHLGEIGDALQSLAQSTSGKKIDSGGLLAVRSNSVGWTVAFPLLLVRFGRFKIQTRWSYEFWIILPSILAFLSSFLTNNVENPSCPDSLNTSGAKASISRLFEFPLIPHSELSEGQFACGILMELAQFACGIRLELARHQKQYFYVWNWLYPHIFMNHAPMSTLQWLNLFFTLPMIFVNFCQS